MTLPTSMSREDVARWLYDKWHGESHAAWVAFPEGVVKASWRACADAVIALVEAKVREAVDLARFATTQNPETEDSELPLHEIVARVMKGPQ